MTTSSKKWANRFREWQPWFAGACVAITSNMAAEDVRSLFDSTKQFAAIGVFFIALFAAACFWFYFSSSKHFRPRTRHLRVGEVPKRQHVILFLSNLSSNNPHIDGIPPGISLNDDLSADIAKITAIKVSKGIRWPWEMPLRAIAHHVGRLSTVTLICSRESILQVHWFRAILARYPVLGSLPVKVLGNSNDDPEVFDCPIDSITDTRRGWDFEDFDRLMEGVTFLLRDFLVKECGYSEKEIVVDFTGGQKVTSVVAAAATVNLSVVAQYVQTNPPYAVRGYDLTEARSDTGSIGL